jgi:hypothetical protein
MKTVKAAMIIFFLGAGLVAQAPAASASQPANPELNAIIADVQRVALSSSGDLSKVHIEKWKTDGEQKQQMQHEAESLQRNINFAIPGLISDLQADPGSVSKAFKLYHDMNAVYESLISLAEGTGAFGRKEEYEPLASDAYALNKVRQNLAAYLERTTTILDAQVKRAASATSPQTTASQQQPKKIIVDDDTPSKKTKKTVQKKPTSSQQ